MIMTNGDRMMENFASHSWRYLAQILAELPICFRCAFCIYANEENMYCRKTPNDNDKCTDNITAYLEREEDE